MKMNLKKSSMFVFASAVIAVGATATVSLGGFMPSAKCGPDRCLDVYNPVTCPNGQTYPNACYAAKACQKNCGAY